MHPEATPFENLSPDTVIDAVESSGLRCDGRLLALNSYENRVYQVGLEDDPPLIAKFYRPGRWSDAAILEEHDFTRELAAAELPVVAPLIIDGHSLHHHAGHRFALFPRQGGHAPELDDESTLRHLGRVMGRWHAVGSRSRFRHRPQLTLDSHGREPVDWLLRAGCLPPALEEAFARLCDHLLVALEAAWARAGQTRNLRLHGDCHQGNILWRDGHAQFVDLDDTLTGPAIQDLWMLLSGGPEDMQRQLAWLLEGYRLFHDFDPRELHLIEPLRSLRILHFNAWIGRRWSDPAFPAAFPWFASPRHWESVIAQLQEQLSALQEPMAWIID